MQRSHIWLSLLCLNKTLLPLALRTDSHVLLISEFLPFEMLCLGFLTMEVSVGEKKKLSEHSKLVPRMSPAGATLYRARWGSGEAVRLKSCQAVFEQRDVFFFENLNKATGTHCRWKGMDMRLDNYCSHKRIFQGPFNVWKQSCSEMQNFSLRLQHKE